ncbi:MAG: sporulation protein YunB [Clostridia bacterium]|nr:sporulation protein YunB [Clostridia bacterium]
MRLKFYKLALRQMSIKKPFVFFLITVLTIVSSFFAITKKVEPVIRTLCESSAHRIALNATNETVNEYIELIKYDNLISIKQNDAGKVIALNANVMEMNRLTTSISSDIQKKLANTDNSTIKIPLGTIFNVGILSGYGPRMSIKIVPSGTVSAKFNSSFEQTGVNQTKHRIYLSITTKVKIVAPFYTSSQEYTNEITVAETIIVGDTPNTYYNITGLKNDNLYDVIN